MAQTKEVYRGTPTEDKSFFTEFGQAAVRNILWIFILVRFGMSSSFAPREGMANISLNNKQEKEKRMNATNQYTYMVGRSGLRTCCVAKVYQLEPGGHRELPRAQVVGITVGMEALFDGISLKTAKNGKGEMQFLRILLPSHKADGKWLWVGDIATSMPVGGTALFRAKIYHKEDE